MKVGSAPGEGAIISIPISKQISIQVAGGEGFRPLDSDRFWDVLGH